jgi:hypothetical protein
MKTRTKITAQAHATVATPSTWPTFDHAIELDEARELIARHKRTYPGERSAAGFTRVALDRILAQPRWAGIRMYFALNPDATRTLVLVGVDADGKDLDQGVLAERGMPCPPYCDIDSQLDW